MITMKSPVKKCCFISLILMIFFSCVSGPGKTALSPELVIIGSWTVDVGKTSKAWENALVADTDLSFKISLGIMTDAVITFTKDSITIFKQSDTDPLNETISYRIVSATGDSVTIVNIDEEESEMKVTIVIADNNTIKWYENGKTDMPVIIFRRI